MSHAVAGSDSGGSSEAIASACMMPGPSSLLGIATGSVDSTRMMVSNHPKLGLQAYNVAQPHGTIAAGSVVVRTVNEMYQHGGSSSSS